MEADGIIKDMFDNQDRNKDGKILEEELMVKEDEERVVRDELWGECGPVVAPATVKKVVLEVIMEAIQTDSDRYYWDGSEPEQEVSERN